MDSIFGLVGDRYSTTTIIIIITIINIIIIISYAILAADASAVRYEYNNIIS